MDATITRWNFGQDFLGVDRILPVSREELFRVDIRQPRMHRLGLQAALDLLDECTSPGCDDCKVI